MASAIDTNDEPQHRPDADERRKPGAGDEAALPGVASHVAATAPPGTNRERDDDDRREGGTEGRRSSAIDRREAIRRVALMLGGAALGGSLLGRAAAAGPLAFVAGGTRLLAAIESGVDSASAPIGEFTLADIAFLDEVAETILPETKTPGAKAAHTGAFMARMVTDCYWPAEQAIFRDGMHRIDAATKAANGVAFIDATPAQRLAVLQVLDREQKNLMDSRDSDGHERHGAAPVAGSDHRPGSPAPEHPADQLPIVGIHAPGEEPRRAAPFFRMMKELAMLGYFTSEIGCTVAQRYAETPGRYDPCVPYRDGDPAWADHA